MYKFLPVLIFTCFIHANEIVFSSISEHRNGEINVSLTLDKVAYINSYSLADPSRLVMEINDAYSKKPISEIYNYPIKKIRSESEDNLTKVIIDLYDNVFWHKPVQEVTDSGVLLNLKLRKDKTSKKNIRDIKASCY